jgi:hypothetical protein
MKAKREDSKAEGTGYLTAKIARITKTEGRIFSRQNAQKAQS